MPDTTTMVPTVLVLLVLSANIPGHYAADYQYEDDDYIEGCHPEEADTCFKDVNVNLMCNLGKTIPDMNCTGRDAHDLCMSMNDALHCCDDIMDSCSEDDGLDIFQEWYIGLEGVYSHLCIEDEELGLISDLLQGSNCFRLKKFISCVEDKANLTHVADLLTTTLDLHECNMLQVSVAACIEDAEKNRRQCRGRADVVKEALIVFFSTTRCGHAPPPPSPPPCIPPTTETSATTTRDKITSNTTTNTGRDITTITSTTHVTSIPNQASTNGDNSSMDSTSPSPMCQEPQDLSKISTSMASTIVVTVLVTLVLVGLTGMLLLKRGVVTIKTDFDRRLTGLDGETSGGYDRF